MSLERAPLYVVAYDLCRFLEERRCLAHGDSVLLTHAAETGRRLATAAAAALTFPERRIAHLIGVDERIVELRILLRLARDGGTLTAGAARHAHAELLRIGQMVGGWRRALRRRHPTNQGSGPEAASAACSAAGPTGTTRGTAAPPTATGMTPTTPGTTTASASASPPRARRSRRTP